MKFITFEVEMKRPRSKWGNYQTWLKIYLFGKLVYNKHMKSYTPDFFNIKEPSPQQILYSMLYDNSETT